jgi:putative (di)nucleoside polyphosphate hydrolase
MSENQYFRAGTATVIYNSRGEILLFARSDISDVWQLQQGGMDVGENIEETLWRELREETALSPEDFISNTKYPTWLYYEYPEEVRKKIIDSNTLGQIHHWYFLQLKPGTVINLDLAHDDEFSDYKWSTFSDLLAKTDKIKIDVYTKLDDFFTKEIRPTLTN